MKKTFSKNFILRNIALAVAAIVVCAAFVCPADAGAASRPAKPAKVKNVTASSSFFSVTLKWKKAKKASKYQVYQWKNKKWKRVSTVKGARCKIKKLKENTRYRFKVRGIRGAKKGSFSRIKTVRTKSVMDDFDLSRKPYDISVGETATYNVELYMRYGAPKLSKVSISGNKYVSVSKGSKIVKKNGVYRLPVTVKGKAAGEGRFTVVAYGRSFSWTQNVDGGGGKLKSISIVSCARTMEIEDRQEFSLRTDPAGYDISGLTVTSSNSDVISVRSFGTTSATIAAVSSGTATVSVKYDGKTYASAEITVNDPPGLKYSYEIYKLKGQKIYYDAFNYGVYDARPYSYGCGGNVFLIKTKNPMKDSWIKIAGVQEVDDSGVVYVENYPAGDGIYSISELKELDENYKDLNIPDYSNGKYNYIYMCPLIYEGGKHVVKEHAYDGSFSNVSSINTTIKGYSYKEEYNSWIDGYIDKYSGYSNKDKLEMICNELERSATYMYARSSEYVGPTNNFKIKCTPFWQSYFWDSAVRYPIFNLAQKLGATKWDYKEPNPSKPGHHIVYVWWGEERVEYEICPNMNTAKRIEDYIGTTTLDDFEYLTTFE